jgi:hypothetical protein
MIAGASPTKDELVSRLGVGVTGLMSAAELAAHSRSLLDTPLFHDGHLWVSVVADDAHIAGAFQRVVEASRLENRVRRGSGGPDVRVGPNTLHVALALRRPDSLFGGDEKRIVNRCVRPLLRGLASVGAPSAFFGRDWISVSKQPAAWVGFGHDASTGRTLFEAFVGVSVPFAEPGRESFRGKAPASLATIMGRALDPGRLAAAVSRAYAEGHDVEAIAAPPRAEPRPGGGGVELEPAWAATCEEAIGTIGAGPDSRGVFRIGGDWLVSRDAVARLEARVVDADAGEIGGLVDEALAAPGVAIDGVRTLASVEDVVARALQGTRARAKAPRG